MKIVFAGFGLLCLLALGGAIWAMNDLARYEALPLEQRQQAEAVARKALAAERRKALKGTDCEFPTAVECYVERAEARRIEANLKALRDSGELDRMEEAQRDAGR